MTDPSRTSPAASEKADTDSRGSFDPTHPHAEGSADEPKFAAPAHAGEVGTFGRYRVLKKLGQGGMGAVYLGYDSALDRKIALKVVLPQFAANAGARERFLREARSAAKIKSDHIVTIHDVGEERGTPFIAMEYLFGMPLDQFLKTKGDLPLPQALRVVRETALGLAAAHDLGLIHRDIKPGNIWLEAPKGRVKLLDFGLARPVNDDAHLTGSGAVMGTPAYMSPEQGRGQKLDHRTDLFSLGVMLYRLCTGKLPFTGDSTMAVLTSLAVDTPISPRQLNPQVSEALEAVIGRLVAKNPAERFQSAQEVVDALTEIEQPRSGSGLLPVVVAVPFQSMAVGAQTQNVWDGIDASESVAVPLESGAETAAEPEPAPSRHPRPVRKAAKWPAVAAVAVFLLAGVALASILFGPSNGKLVVESDDPDAELVIKKDGQVVRDRTKDREFALRTGTYTFELVEPKPGLKLERDRVEIVRDETARVTIRLQVKPITTSGSRKDKDKDKDKLPDPSAGTVYPLPADLRREQVPVKPEKVFTLDHLDPAKHIPPEEKFPWQPPELVAVLGSHRQRLPGGILTLAVSPDGAAVLAGWDEPAFACDMKTGKPLDWPLVACFSPDGKHAAGVNKVWEVADLKKPPVEYPIQGNIRAFLTNDIVLATAEGGARYVAWKLDPKEPKVLANFPGVSGYAVSNDRKYLAIAFQADQSCRVYDIAPDGPKEKCVLPAPEGKVRVASGSHCMSLSDTGLLATVDPTETIRVWDIAGPKPQLRHTIDAKCDRGVYISPKGDYLIRRSDHLLLEVWSLKGDKPRRLALAPDPGLLGSHIGPVVVTPDGKTIITGHLNGAVRFWGIEKDVIFERNPIRPQPTVDWFGDFSPDGRFAALFHEDVRTHIWELGELKSRPLVETGETPNRFAPDSAAIATYRRSSGGGLRLVSSADQPGAAPVDFGTGFRPGCYSPDGNWLAAYSQTELAIWDVSVSPPKERFARVPGFAARFWRFTPDGRFLIAYGPKPGGRWEAEIWAMTARGPVRRQEITLPTQHFALSPDGRTAVICHGADWPKYYELKEGVLSFLRAGPDGSGSTWADFSPDGRTLLTGVLNGLKLLDVATGKEIKSWALRGAPLAGRFHPDGRHLFVTNADHTTYVLRLPKELLERLNDPDRRAAEYVLSLGGKVKVNGQQTDLKSKDELPKDPFRVTGVGFPWAPNVTDADVVHFSDCKHLTFLSLGSTKVTDAGLANFKNCKSLTTLYLFNSQMGDAGMAVFKDCDLQVLVLGGSQVSDAGLVHYCGWKNLAILDLSNTRVTDKGLALLADCKQLNHINVKGTKVTAEKVAEFAKALPQCKIEHDGGVIEPKK